MMTSWNGDIFRVTGHLCGEFTGPGEFPAQRPVTRSFGVSFDLRRNKRLNKQSCCWWFETLLRPLWRQWNVIGVGDQVQFSHEAMTGLWSISHIIMHDVIKWKHFPRYCSLCREFAGHRWIPLTKSSDAELWCFLWSVPK